MSTHNYPMVFVVVIFNHVSKVSIYYIWLKNFCTFKTGKCDIKCSEQIWTLFRFHCDDEFHWYLMQSFRGSAYASRVKVSRYAIVWLLQFNRIVLPSRHFVKIANRKGIISFRHFLHILSFWNTMLMVATLIYSHKNCI